MHLPPSLQSAIDNVVESFGLGQLIEAREVLTDRYRHPSGNRPFMTTDLQRQAYVISRLPATYAAIYETLKSIQERAHELPIRSMLDLGAGPGTAMWAICEKFPEVSMIDLIERDSSLSLLGQRLGQFSENEAMQRANWQIADLNMMPDLPFRDLVILSYSVGELDHTTIAPLIERSWKATQQLLIVIEPGTPVGFERIRTIRSQLIAMGAHLIAPCPHHLACPMEGGDWCHFAARVERSALHRRLKGGTLGYEDEKYSYVAATKAIFPLPGSRVLRHPLRHSGHVTLKLCTAEEGVQCPTISKRMGELYKLARKIEWGDPFT